MRPKTSPIWNYFVEINDSKAKCKICDKEYSRKGRTTTALKSHLKALHSEIYAQFRILDESGKLTLEAKIDEDNPAESVKCVFTPLQERDNSPRASTLQRTKKQQRPMKRKITSCSSDSDVSNEVIQAEQIQNNTKEDRFDVYGQNVAMKLRGLPNMQRLIAEKIINDTLFHAEMGNLTLRQCEFHEQFFRATSPSVRFIRGSPSPPTEERY